MASADTPATDVVYYIELPDNCVKIGSTNNLRQRFARLRYTTRAIRVLTIEPFIKGRPYHPGQDIPDLSLLNTEGLRHLQFQDQKLEYRYHMSPKHQANYSHEVFRLAGDVQEHICVLRQTYLAECGCIPDWWEYAEVCVLR